MDEPGAWVIGFESDGNEAVSGEQHYVPARRIIEFEIQVRGAGEVESLVGLLENREVVTVEVDLGSSGQPAKAKRQKELVIELKIGEREKVYVPDALQEWSDVHWAGHQSRYRK